MPKEIDAEITVYAVAVGPKIIFQIESDFSNGGSLQFHGEPGDKFIMKFSLVDNGLGLKFLQNPKDAFWIRKNFCPKEESSNKNFKPKKVGSDGKSLIVENKNEDISLYYYALRFEDKDGKLVEYDPIIDNRNSGVKPSFHIIPVLAASAVSLLVGFAAGHFL